MKNASAPANAGEDVPAPADGEGGGSSVEQLSTGPEPPAELLSTSVFAVSLLAGIVFLSVATPLLLLSLFSLAFPGSDPRCFDDVREMALALADPKQGVNPCEDFFGNMCSNFENPDRLSFTSLLESRLSAYRDLIIDEHEAELSEEIASSGGTAYRRCIGEYSGPISRRGRAHARARAACQGSRGGRSSLAHRGPPKLQPTSARPAMAQEINEELGRVLRERGLVGDTFDNIERKAKIKREQVVYGGVAVTCMLFMLNILGAKTSVLITTVWPMLGSIRAIDRADVLAMQKWTAYWIVYALVNVIFRFVFAGIYLHFRRIYFLRLLFLAWCAAPIQANGANVIFQKAFAGKIFKEGGRGVPGGIPPMGAAPAAGGREMSDNGRKMKR